MKSALTNPQKSIYFTEEYYKGTNINNIAGIMSINQEVDFDKFILAIKQFVKQNDSCRILLNEELKQQVCNYEDFPIEIIDVNSKDELFSIANEIASQPFALYNSYLFKFVVFRFPNNYGGFIVNMHHLIADSWTLGITVNEIIEIYSAYLKNEEYEEKDINLYSYKNYIASEQEYINSSKYEKDKEYWEQIFTTVPDNATIPSINSNSEDSTKALRKQLSISSSLLENIKKYCETQKVSLFNFLTAVFSLYIGRVSNLDDFCIGTPILNRSNFKEKNMTGMFINTLPLRVNIDNTLSFNDFLNFIMASSMSLLRHQKYSYQNILEDLRKKQNNLPGLYKIMVSYQITKMNEEQDSIPHDSTWLFNGNMADDIDIHIFDLNDTNELNIAYDYKCAKYTAKDMEQIHSRILHIISQVLNNENLKLSDIEIVTPEEKEKLIYGFNQTKLDYPKDKTIAELFEEQVKLTPDNVAVVFENKSLTYKELNEKASGLAYYLVNELNVKPHTLIGIMTSRSFEMIIGLIAILKCGCCYIPIDPEYPSDRIHYMIENSNATILLTDNKNYGVINNITNVNISLQKSRSHFLVSNTSSKDLAYVIYTSGSTGTPKGIMITNENVINYLYALKQIVPINKYKSFASVTTMCFDIFVTEIWGSLLNGLSLILANEREQNIGFELNELCNNHHVDIIQTTPSRFKLLINSTEDLSFFKNLSIVMVGGEPLPSELITFFNNYPNIKLYNVYGPTETTVWSSIKVCPDAKHVTIGTPIGNTQIYILDASYNLLPFNTPGEIYIGGDGLAKGYFNNNDLTAKSFIKSPFNEQALLYKTGDLAYIQENGEIVHLGRADSQTKINGFRVELSEIENVILTNKDIKEAVVTYTDNILAAFYVSNSTIDSSYLFNKLPYYMIPKVFYKLDKMPLTPNGKINKKALPKVSLGLKEKEKIEPRNSVDKMLIDFLQNDFADVNILDSITELGADSLTAIGLSVFIQKNWGISVTVKDIFTHPVLRDLSDFIADQTNKNTRAKINKIENRNYYPASSAQKRIFFASQADENSTLYNIAGGLLLDKVPNSEKLENCLNELISRHTSLRTYFDFVDDELVQKIIPNFHFSLQVENADWNNKDNIIKDFIKPFNLLQAPLFRAKLIVFENSKAMLLIDLHHSISDGTSLSIFVKELCALYNDETLEPNEINYKDFAVWENNYFKSNTYKEDKNYWLEKFNPEPPILDMPCTMQRPARQSFEGASYHFSFDKNQVLDIAKSESITPYMLLLAAYFILLYKYTGSDDIVIGTPIMNREKHNLENVLGMFVNNLALRTKIDASKNIKEFLQEVKNSCLEDFSHQNYPFNNLIKDLGIKRDISRNPIFDTMFIYQNNGYSPTKLGDINASYIIPDLNISKFDLSLEVIPTSSSFELRFEYCTKLFTKEYIEKMATHYKNILDYLTNNLHSSIAEVNMLSREEENKILNEFNNTYMPYNKLFPLVSLFEKQVEAFPNKTAIIFEDSHITYSCLNEKVNSLAHVLIEKYHIQKNAVVGILLKRSIETVVSMLAVLKAGATYLLIDEALPFDRIIFMLENSKSPLLITDYELKNIDFKHKLMLSDVDFEKYSKTNPNVNCSNDDGFCVIYTSGSTGTPKGVLLKRVGVLNLLFNHQKLMDTNKCENFLSISAISFDMFIVENFVALLSGKTVILSNEEQQKIPLYTAELIKKYKADFILTTPTRMNLLLEVPDALGSLKVIQLGGEVFSPELYAKLKSMTNANIYNGYGPSEATACSACKFITSNDITIGRPFYNVQIYICDNDLNLRPIGFPGEICISGDGVGCGYVNNNELTEKSFVKNPFGSGVLYKTGDLAYYNENGEIEYIGRKDFQIKIRGLRVELSEIEKQMLKLPNIKNVAVLYNSNAGYISAFYTSSCDEDVTSMRSELAKKLPLYMVPKYFIKLDELPVTTNGKVNKKLLQNYSIDTKKGGNNYVPPQTERQKLFCDVWSKLLDTQIGIEDNVFECGADSLIAIKFKTELLSYKINIPYANIFDYPTVKELAENSSQVIKQKNSFDYSNINKILDKNSMQYIGNITKNDNNNILLLGSNGFVGAHILYSFIKNDKGTAYCIVRNKKGEDAYNRLINTLHFYFGTELDSYINNRIIIYTGNVLEENLGLGNNEFNNVINNISTIVNAAAIVKHYGDEKKFEEINVNLVRKASEICEKFNKRFIHISTTSVCGDSKLDTVFSEKNLYIGQDLDNVYIKTKFEAERLVLEKVANGLNAQILRLGNITNRFSDGMFQINADSNAFINRLKTFIELACMPRSFMKMPLEFTPVDLCANSIIAILQNNIPNVCVLHLYNDKLVNMEDLVSVLRSNGFDLKVVDDKEFENIVQETLSSDNKEVLSGIVVDMNKSTNINYLSPFKLNSEFSKEVLSLLGFSWNKIDSKYLQKYIKYLKQIKFI